MYFFTQEIRLVNLVLLDTYATTASLPHHKSRTISMTTAGMAIGICIGPGLQLFFIPFGHVGLEIIKDHIYVNMYTAVSLCAVCFNLLAIVLMGCVFDEVYAGAASQAKKVVSWVFRILLFRKSITLVFIF